MVKILAAAGTNAALLSEDRPKASGARLSPSKQDSDAGEARRRHGARGEPCGIGRGAPGQTSPGSADTAAARAAPATHRRGPWSHLPGPGQSHPHGASRRTTAFRAQAPVSRLECPHRVESGPSRLMRQWLGILLFFLRQCRPIVPGPQIILPKELFDFLLACLDIIALSYMELIGQMCHDLRRASR